MQGLGLGFRVRGDYEGPEQFLEGVPFRLLSGYYQGPKEGPEQSEGSEGCRAQRFGDV